MKNNTGILKAMAVISAAAGLICLIVNLAVNWAVTWSLYPIGGLVLLLVTLCPALLLRRGRILATVLVGFAAALGYLFLVQYLTGTSGWALGLGLPVAMVSFLLVYGVAKAFCHLGNKWYATAILLVVIGILQPVVNGIVSRYLAQQTASNDISQLIVLPACLLAALILAVVGGVRGRARKV